MNHSAKNDSTLSAGKIQSIVLLLFFCSGISGLIYEVVWTRLLTVILGNTVYVVSMVLTVFMAGLALGSFCAGRIIDRRKDALRVYAILQLAIGVTGFCLTSVLNQSSFVYLWMHNSLAGYPALLSVGRYVFTFFLLIVPTTLMGATLPVLCKFVVVRQSVVGTKIGILYALNTFGAALGCYLAGFVLIGNIGIRLTICTASAVSIAVGAAAWYFQKRAPAAGPGPDAQQADEEISGQRPALFRYLILVAFAISGLAALGYEVVWTRILTSYLGNSVYAFSTMLTTFLVGLALGGLVISAFVDKRKRPTTDFGLIEAAIGFYVLLSIYVFGLQGQVFASLKQVEPVWHQTGLRFAKAFALMFVPTLLMGAVFPIAGRIYIANFKRIGRGVGELYAWNTGGTIIGAAVTGFVLMPMLGLEKTLVILLCLNLGIAIVLCAAEPADTRKNKVSLLVALVIAMGLGLANMPRDVFRKMYEIANPNKEILFYKQDLVGTVVVEQIGKDRRILIDDLDVAGTSMMFLASHKSLGHLPMLLHPNPRKVFVLGFGGGGTAYATSTYPEVELIDAVELSPSVADVAEMFTQINHNVMADARFNLYINDGRHLLLTSPHKYDVISVDLLWLQTAGAGSLYTKEFYQLCHSRLSDNGLMVERLHPGFIPPEYLRIIFRTVQSVFPHTSLWFSRQQKHLVLVASKVPLRLDFDRLAERIANPATQHDLAEVGLDKPEMLMSYFIAGNDTLVRFAGSDGPINTDNLPIIEYELPHYTASAVRENIIEMEQINESVIPLFENISSEQKQRIGVYEQSTKLMLSSLVDFGIRNIDQAIIKCRQVMKDNPGYIDAKYWEQYYSDYLHRAYQQGRVRITE